MVKQVDYFSLRYRNICRKEGFIIELSYELKDGIADILFTFNEPMAIRESRYDNWTTNTCVSRQVLEYFFIQNRFDVSLIAEVDNDWIARRDTCEVFDLVELWSAELSDGEKSIFQQEINNTLAQGNIPWRIIQGRMIKIDALQFEEDLILETLTKMENTASAIPIFSNASNEFISALESMQAENYSTAILYAAMSYESTLKTVLGKPEGTADILTREFINSTYANDLPRVIKPGFKDNVMMTLPYLRNKLAVGHGKGTEDIATTKSLARLACNLAASLNAFLVGEYIARNESIVNTDAVENLLSEDELPF